MTDEFDWKECSQSFEVPSHDEATHAYERKIAESRERIEAMLNKEFLMEGRAPEEARPRFARLLSYLRTLWRAIKGEQPYDDYDW